MNATHYAAYIQMPVILHGNKSDIVETEIRLPIWYQPQQGSFLYHKAVNGLVRIGPVFFDGDRDTIVISVINAAYDFTTTLDEWLADRPLWRKAETPFIVNNLIDPTDEHHDGR